MRTNLYMSWEKTFWVFNLSLRLAVLQSHKETTSDHLIVMNSIHIQPLCCWCISKACLGPGVVSSLLPKPPLCWLEVREGDGSRASPPWLVCKTLTLSPLCFHYGASIFLWAFHFWHYSSLPVQTADSHTPSRSNIVKPLWIFMQVGEK